MNKKLASFLLTEVNQWEKERIISSQQAQLLQQRYRAQATKHSQNLLQIILTNSPLTYHQIALRIHLFRLTDKRTKY